MALLAPEQKMKKTKATLHFETSNVEASTVPLFFFNFCSGAEIQPLTKIEKTKGTCFSQTLKVEENNVNLFFSMFAQGLRYSLFLIFCQPGQQGAIFKFRKWLYHSL